jgi:hypothetical protein
MPMNRSGCKRQQARAQCAAQLQQSREVPEYLEQAHHGQFLAVPPGVHAGVPHAPAADADEAGLRPAAAQPLDQRGAQLVAGGLPGHEGNDGCLLRHHGAARRVSG